MPTYPRTYRASRGWQVLLIGSSLILGVPSCFGLVYFISGHEADSKNATYFAMGVCAIFAAFSLYTALSVRRSKIVLFDDRIEIHELTVTRSLRRDDISGWRINTQLVLESKNPSRRTVSTGWVYKADPEFYQWFEPIDNLDETEMEQAVDEIATDQRLGRDVEERMESLARAKRLARVLNILGDALFLWGVFSPSPYELVIGLLLVAPWLAAVTAWWFGGLIQFDERPGDVKPNVVYLSLAPTVALALRAVLDYQTIGWKPQTVAALLIGSALFAAQRATHPDVRKKRATAAITFVLAVLAYGYGAALQINALADSAEISQTRYRVREKFVSKGTITRYQVRLSKVHPTDPEVSSTEVTESFYGMLKPGDAVCLAVKPGALGIKWFSAGPCPPGTP